MLEKLFKLKENNTNVKTEVIGGITTFMTMAYILAVNPQILSASGMDFGNIDYFMGCLDVVCRALFRTPPRRIIPPDIISSKPVKRHGG